jgi:hypothetical protein
VGFFRIVPTLKNRRRLNFNIKMCLKKKENFKGARGFLFQDRDKWPAVVNMVINILVP